MDKPRETESHSTEQSYLNVDKSEEEAETFYSILSSPLKNRERLFGVV